MKAGFGVGLRTLKSPNRVKIDSSSSTNAKVRWDIRKKRVVILHILPELMSQNISFSDVGVSFASSSNSYYLG